MNFIETQKNDATELNKWLSLYKLLHTTFLFLFLPRYIEYVIIASSLFPVFHSSNILLRWICIYFILFNRKLTELGSIATDAYRPGPNKLT